MRKLLVILIITFSFFSFTVYGKGSDPSAVKGILDLRNLKNPEHFVVNLNGEWEFYWKKMLRPYDFKTGNYKPDYYGKVPSYWTDYPQDSVRTEKYGYATYRLTILLPAGFNRLWLLIFPFSTHHMISILTENIWGAMAHRENQLMKLFPNTKGIFTGLIRDPTP